MQLSFHSYKYFPYERELAAREVRTLFHNPDFIELENGLKISGEPDATSASRLTYFAGLDSGQEFQETTQARLEHDARNGKNRQATRYSVHGLHEYKGKFNPQVVRALLNIFDVSKGGKVLDPFCGSGTTLVECAHFGAHGYGTDLNPFAVFVANAKLLALKTRASKLRTVSRLLASNLQAKRSAKTSIRADARGEYLRAWFDTEILSQIECVRQCIEDSAGDVKSIFLVIASNLLREYSQQDPGDLRIRRRKSALPELPFVDAFLASVETALVRLEDTQRILGKTANKGSARLCDVADISLKHNNGKFDTAITSPPYAMALPYIDTQRLSLVWLNLLEPKAIHKVEANLIGSRELRGIQKKEILSQLELNAAQIPNAQASFCVDLQHALTDQDGFRRQAVPTLLYRYFAAMRDSFSSVKRCMKKGAPYALIVGHNHSTLGGVRRDIDTPMHLAALAENVGWKIEELIPMQTYRRYGYNVSNAVAAETLIILRN